MSLLSQLRFEVSVHDLATLPSTQREIAFAGRSNAGKSSAINALAGHKLAYVSKTPGRTQLLNFFCINPGNYLVDLPGYGYAQVPAELRAHWQRTLARYLESRESLIGLVLIMDIRHPLTPLDQQMLQWFGPSGRPVHILLTKADKLSKSQAATALAATRESLHALQAQVTLQLFSSPKKLGLAEAEATLAEWLNETDGHKKPPVKGEQKPGAETP